MSRGVIQTEVHQYVAALCGPESEADRFIGEQTAPLPGAGMRIGADQARFFTLLTGLLGVKKAVEVGTYTGTSALAIARGLPADGRLVCCDVNPETTAIAVEGWRRAGVAERIELRLAPAVETLTALLHIEGEGSFDLAFIDADKENYAAYYELCLSLLRTGGVLLLDNMLWSGRVLGPERDATSQLLHDLNERLSTDTRVEAVLLTIGDGVTLLRKR